MVKNILPARLLGKRQAQQNRRDGDAAMRRRDWLSAAKLYREYLAEHADDAPILVQLGHALKEMRRFDEALETYGRAVTVAPGDSDAKFHLTALIRTLGRNWQTEPVTKTLQLLSKNEAIADIGLAPPVDLDVGQDVNYLSRGDWERDQRNWPNAAKYYNEHLIAHPRDAAIWVQLGHMLKEMSLFDDAIYAYKVAKRLETEPSDVAIHLAELLTRLGRATDATPLWADMFRKQKSFLSRQLKLDDPTPEVAFIR
jgi:tetratricopeptide (TPR) repeat protein